jgi:hypothetical protein
VYLFRVSKGILTFRKILQHGADGFVSFPKEGVLWIFIAIKNPSLWASFEPSYFGSNGNHAVTRPSRTTCKFVCVCTRARARVRMYEYLCICVCISPF